MLVFGGKGWEASVVLLIGLMRLLDDEEKLIFGVGDGCSYTFSTLLASFLWRLAICARLCCEAVVSL